MREWFEHWLSGDVDVMENIMDAAEVPDIPREIIKEQKKRFREEVYGRQHTKEAILAEQRGFYLLYRVVAIASCIVLIGAMLYTVANLPDYGQENPRTVEVVKRYVEQGLKETGAINIVAGMILDYRAFDTLGESHVLFTALVCVMILLGRDKKNMRVGYEDYYKISRDAYFDISHDSIIRTVGTLILPCILLFGTYVLLNGQNGPGGGFSGGAIMGAALIIFSAAFGLQDADRLISRRAIMAIISVSLTFYSFAKGYVFFTGANGIENHIPKGTPGAILSGGLILPLDIAVGMVVACIMFGFFSLFKRGSIGGD